MKKIKICGVNDAAFARRAAELGADFLGLIFAEGSPRRVSPELARAIVRGLGAGPVPVGVFTTDSVESIVRTAETVGFRTVQLHRRATAEDVAALKARGFAVWTLAGGAPGDAVIYDSSHGDGETVPKAGTVPVVLAGGISAENLAEAWSAEADVLDVSGSLESTKGVKSIARLEAFWARVTELRGT